MIYSDEQESINILKQDEKMIKNKEIPHLCVTRGSFEQALRRNRAEYYNFDYPKDTQMIRKNLKVDARS